MKKTKWLQGVKTLFLASALVFSPMLFGCSDDDGGDNTPSEPPVELKSSLYKFNGANASIDNGTITFESSPNEAYAVYPVKIDLEKDSVSIEATVVYSNVDNGEIGVGFISADGTSRKGYTLATFKGVKNVDTTNATGGQGFSTNANFSWAESKPYVIKAEITDAKVNYYVTNEAGVTIEKTGTSSTYYHATTDTVYMAIGGKGTPSYATYSNIKVTYNGTTKTIDTLEDENKLASLSVTPASLLRVKLNETGTVTYVSNATGGTAAGVDLEYDKNILGVADDGNGTLTVTGKAQTTGTDLKITNKSDSSLSKTITVVVENYPSTNEYGSLASITYPAAGSTGAYEDAVLKLTFDSAPTVSESASFGIFKADGTLVDTVKAGDEVLEPNTGYKINVKNQLVFVDGNSVCITPHYGVLEASTEYYVAIPIGAVTGTLNSKSFTGLSADKDAANKWSFTTRAKKTVTAGTPISVNGDAASNADFRTIHGALAAIGETAGEFTINVAAGTYKELVHFKGKSTPTIKIVGATGKNAKTDKVTETVIEWKNFNGWNGSTHTRGALYTNGVNLVLENITVKNAFDRTMTTSDETQAEALYFAGSGKLAASNCVFLSKQDTIKTDGSKSWIYNCYVEGDVDYIWGETTGVCLVENCKLVSVNDPGKTKTKEAYNIVPRTKEDGGTISKGFVILNSEIEIAEGMTGYFGRDPSGSGYYDQGAIINTKVVGSGTLSPKLWLSNNYASPKYIDGKEDKVGWKVYGITNASDAAISTTDKLANTAVVSDADYNLEFNGRRTIFNRVYSKTEDKYITKGAWDETELTALETKFSAAADESKNNTYEAVDPTIKKNHVYTYAQNSRADDTAEGDTEKISFDDMVVNNSWLRFNSDSSSIKFKTVKGAVISIAVNGSEVLVYNDENGTTENNVSTYVVKADGDVKIKRTAGQ